MFDFVTSIWPSAQRAPATMPLAPQPKTTLDDRWKVAGRSPARKRNTSSKGPAKKRQALPPADGPRDGIDAVILALIACAASADAAGHALCL
jgi:hypothetical protein